jgi:hypothetical protein
MKRLSVKPKNAVALECLTKIAAMKFDCGNKPKKETFLHRMIRCYD